jgi:glycosyltransferase involved in cell wall biosynthesis
MNILICTDGIYPYTMGGSHRLNAELISYLISQGNHVYCIIPQISSRSHLRVSEGVEDLPNGLNIIRFPINESNVVLKFISYVVGFKTNIARIMSEVQIDKLIVQYLPALISCYVGSHRNINYLYHGPWSLEYLSSMKGRIVNNKDGKHLILGLVVLPLLKNIEGFFLKKCCNKFMVLSQFMHDSLSKNFKIENKNIRICPGGINVDNFYPDFSKIFRSKTTNKQNLFLTVRRLEKRMGLENLIIAASILKKRNINFDLLIGGQGPMRNSLESLANQYDVNDCIKFLGFIREEELRSYMSISDLFLLLSSDLEGFGLVMLESMACGTPVLVSSHSGSSEVIRDFNSRFICEDLNPNSIASQIEGLLSDGLLGLETKTSSVEFVRCNYSWNKFGKFFSEWMLC